jgi:Tol biopolymer transport system component
MKNETLVLFIIAVCCILLISCDSDSITPEPEDTSYNFAYEDSILFNSTRILGNTNIQIGSTNGTGIRHLCDSLVSYDPSWSSNKRKILFVGSPLYGSNTNWGVYLMDVKNYKIKRIAPRDTLVQYASYSPDLKYIAYCVWDPETHFVRIKLYDTNTGVIKALTDWMSANLNNLSWSPDSKNILVDDGYVINIDNPIFTKLFTFTGQIFMPIWSPDGTKIAFSNSSQGTYMNIYIHNLTTGATDILYPQEQSQFIASWSKDSQQILFDQHSAGNTNGYLCKINIDGTNFVQLTDGSEDNWNPCWYK